MSNKRFEFLGMNIRWAPEQGECGFSSINQVEKLRRDFAQIRPAKTPMAEVPEHNLEGAPRVVKSSDSVSRGSMVIQLFLSLGIVVCSRFCWDVVPPFVSCNVHHSGLNYNIICECECSECFRALAECCKPVSSVEFEC